jgi:hypothetical protein
MQGSCSDVWKLFNLITRGDVQASIDIARAAKADGSSMKTVAVMTMAFLPATFFAALFAVPMLQWDSSPVIKDQFWIYWAFTLPFTAVIFFLWFSITNWEAISRRFLRKTSSNGAIEMDSPSSSLWRLTDLYAVVQTRDLPAPCDRNV